jgi:hypothetical protein
LALEKRGNRLILKGKAINSIDREVLGFIKLFDHNYVIISGYIPIALGRGRTTEDIDMFVEFKDKTDFHKFYEKMRKNGYNMLNGESEEDAYDLLSEGLSLRVIKGDEVFPNLEMKFPKKASDFYSMEHKIILEFGVASILISPLELQIAYKLYLGSDKDYEDARYIYDFAKNILVAKKLKQFIKELKIKHATVRSILGVEIGKE